MRRRRSVLWLFYLPLGVLVNSRRIQNRERENEWREGGEVKEMYVIGV